MARTDSQSSQNGGAFAFSGFEGFEAPNTTPVPDVLFDLLAPHLADAELRVVLYIIRRTYGFKKSTDNISLSQMVHGITTRDGRVLDYGTGLKKSAVTNALVGLLAKGIIIKQLNRSAERGNEPTTYALRFKYGPLSAGTDKGVSAKTDKGLSTGTDTQETVLQETGKQQTVNSNKKKIQRKNDSNLEGGLGGDHPATAQHVDNSPPANILLASRDGSPQITLPLPNQETGETISDSRKQGMSSVGEILAQRNPTPEKHAPQTHPEARSGVISAQPVREAIQPPNGAPTGPTDGQKKREPGRPRKPRTEYLDAVINDFTTEFHDELHERPNLAQARNILVASGLSEDTLVGMCYQARSLTRERANISKYAESVPGLKNKMPYFFEVLRDLAGVREDEAGPLPPIHTPPP